MPEQLALAANIADEAGRLIMDIYETDFNVEYKDDQSPVTEADRRADDLIRRRLSDYFPDAPVISEEADAPPYEERCEWGMFWLVDPLDGTREFIKKSGEFTVNIGLIQAGRPALGVINAPALGVCWCGAAGKGAWRVDKGKDKNKGKPPAPIRTDANVSFAELAVLHSHVKKTPLLDAFLRDSNIIPASRKAVGSSLKFALVAAGEAHLAACLHHTWEWDTAAGEAILLGAGGELLDFNGDKLQYNKNVMQNDEYVIMARCFTELFRCPDA